METRAKFILIGAFTIAGFVGLLAFILWFAPIELDQQYSYYDIRFSSVSGLSIASDVRFGGLSVGQVVDVRLSADCDGTIQVRVEVATDTPVRTDSIATIGAQGVTGVSFVSIGPRTANAPFLTPSDSTVIPQITAGRSTPQSSSESAPDLLNEPLVVVQQVSGLLNGENQGCLECILVNVENVSADFAETLNDFSTDAETVGDFALQIDPFNIVPKPLWMLRALEATQGVRYVGRKPLGSSGDFAIVTEVIDFQAELNAQTDTATVRLRMVPRIVREADASIVASRTFATSASSPTPQTQALINAFDAASTLLLPDFAEWALSEIARR